MTINPNISKGFMVTVGVLAALVLIGVVLNLLGGKR